MSTPVVVLAWSDLVIPENTVLVKAVADMAAGMNADVHIIPGDISQNEGSFDQYTTLVTPALVNAKAKMRPSPGNHDYWSPGEGLAAAYFDYFGNQAGVAGKGWYSFDLPNNWHLICLNSIYDWGGPAVDGASEQGQWLAADLAANRGKHILAYWHYPAAGSSIAGLRYDAFWKSEGSFWHQLDEAGAEIILNGHMHAYERFHPMNWKGERDPDGIRQFIVGTGGAGGTGTNPAGRYPHSAAFATSDTPGGMPFGVLKLTLDVDSYSWEFVPVLGQGGNEAFTDFGSAYTSHPDVVEAWVTQPDGTHVAHLDRSTASPFRAFAFHRERNAPGGGSLEYHLDNATVAANPTIFAQGNLVHMRYRGGGLVWAVRENGSELGQGEHAGDWVKVSGQGLWPHRRLVFPPDFAAGANLDPKTWTTQWRSFVDRAAGELLWDVLSESNARFATQFVRGMVQTTGADGITADYRFEDIGDDVIPAVLAARGGEVRFDGLVFNYYNPGHGADLSDTVIFEEGADLISLRHASINRDSLTWIVGEGVGEGVFAKLAVSEDVTAPERLEAFYAAKEAANVPLLQLLTDAALDEHDDTLERLDIEVDESRFRALDDYDLSDTIRVLAPSRGINRTAPIVAIYVAEDNDRVRVLFDLGLPREDLGLKQEREARATRSQIGVRSRQPQGQLVPFSFNGADVFDSTDTMDVFLFVPDRIYVTIEAKAQLHFREFFAPATAATSGGGSTSGSGGSSTPTSGGNSADHDHVIGIWGSDTPGAYTKRRYGPLVAGPSFNLETSSNANVETSLASDTHTHGVTIAAHDHTTPDHAHGLTYGVFKEAYPASHSVEVRTYERVGASWTLRDTLTGLTDDIEEIDLTAIIDGPGSWRLSIKSAAAQPQGGRLGCDVAGYVLGAIRSS